MIILPQYYRKQTNNNNVWLNLTGLKTDMQIIIKAAKQTVLALARTKIRNGG